MMSRTGGELSGRLERRSLAKSSVFALWGTLIYSLVYSSVFTAAKGEIDAYTQLQNYGFPIGLLPHTVTGYDLASNGKFVLYMEGKCQIETFAFPVVYAKKISGKVAYGKLSDLSGIQVKIYYFWISITTIEVVGDELKFEAGLISTTYPIHPNFDEGPDCVNGLEDSGRPLFLEA